MLIAVPGRGGSRSCRERRVLVVFGHGFAADAESFVSVARQASCGTARRRMRAWVKFSAHGHRVGRRNTRVPLRFTSRPGIAMSRVRTVRATVSSPFGVMSPIVAVHRVKLWARTAHARPRRVREELS